MRSYKVKLSIITSLLVVLSASFVPKLPMVLMTSRVSAQTVDARKVEADRLMQQGEQQYQKGQFKAALLSLEQALQIYQQIGDRAGVGRALGNLGVAYRSLGDYQKAIDFYQQSLAIAQQIGDRAGVGRALGNLGNAYHSLGDYQKAIDFHQQSLAIAQQIGDRAGVGSVLGNLGNAYESLGDYQKAIDFHQQSLAIFKEIGDRAGVGSVLGNLGNAYYSLGDYQKAIDFHQQSLAIAQQIGDRAGVGRALNNLGVAYGLLGDYQKAIDLFQQYLAIAQQIGDRAGVGRVLGGLGIAYSNLGDYQKAIDLFQQSLAIAQQIGDRAGVGSVLGNLGNAYGLLGDYQKAIDFHQQYLAIAQQIGDRAGVGTVLGNLGNAYYSLGDYQKAIDLFQQDLAIAKELGDRAGVGGALGNLGNAYYSLGDYQKAIDLFQQRLAIAKELGDRAGVGGALGNLGVAYESLGDYQKAIDFHQQSLAIAKELGDRAGVGRALGNLGIAYRSLGDYQKAIDFHQQYLAIAQQIGDRAGVGRALNNLGVALFNSGNLAEAEKVLKQGIEVLKSQRGRLGNRDDFKISIFEEQARTYRTLQKVYIAQNKSTAALEVAESGRARAFVDLLTSRLSQEGDVSSSTDATIDQIKQIAKSQNATFVQYSIIGDKFKIAGKQQWKESELYIWVIKPTGEVTFRKADLKPLWQKENTTLAKLVSTTRESLGVDDDSRSIFSQEVVNPGNQNTQTQSLQKLHQLLINPIADLLPTDPNQRVTFVPQEDLFLVPFPALMDAKSKYLIEKHTILTAPAIQVLELTRQQKQRIGQSNSIPNNAVVVGNPTMPKFADKYGEAAKQLKPLYSSQQEAQAIASLLNTNALTGDKATETAIKAKLPQARVIHLATHALFDNYQGLQSSIALASSDRDDGLLTAEEILDLKLNADLVVLSACNTGRGRITGDGVIGLSRSLFSAGTPSVVVSLWSVPDAPTAKLMTDFYENMYKNKLDKAQALRQAMLKMKQQYPDTPRKWAAFTLIGEAE